MLSLIGGTPSTKTENGCAACDQPRDGPSPRPDRRRRYRCAPDLLLQAALIQGKPRLLEAECRACPVRLCAFNRDQGHARLKREVHCNLPDRLPSCFLQLSPEVSRR